MISIFPLYRDPWYTFSFEEDRLIDRFHLDGLAPGHIVTIYRFDSANGKRGDQLDKATVGEEGWVELSEALVMRVGESIIAVPE